MEKPVQFIEEYGNAPELWKVNLNDYKNRIKSDTLKWLSLKNDYQLREILGVSISNPGVTGCRRV